MAAIESLGIGSDLLTSDLVDSIINADKAAGELRLDTQQDIIDTKISAYGDIQSQLYTLSEAIVTLADSDNAGATLASSSDETILSATATTSAPVGTYTVEVEDIAKAHSLVSASYTTTADQVGAGSLTFTLGTTSYTGGGAYDSFSANGDAATATITTDSSTTLSGLRDLINDENMGVKATLINDGTGYVLQLTSEETGIENSMEIIAYDSNGALATSGVSAFAYNENQSAAGTNMTETQEGEDALLSVNGLSVTRSSNEVTELIEGVTLTLNSADAGTEVSITVAADTASLTEDIQAMIDAYNGFHEVYQAYTAFDSTSETGALLMGDSTLRSIDSQIKSILTSTVSGITGTDFSSLSELGIYTDQNDSFNMAFDVTLFLEGLSEDREAVVGVFSEQGSTTDSNITFQNESINTVAGEYDIVITQLATQGDYQGGTVSILDFAADVEVDDANDEFTLNLNGQSADITLTQGSYSSGDDLATEIQLQINSNSTFQNYGHSASVTYDSSDQSFNIASNNFGSSSQVYFSSVDSNTANSLGFAELGEGEFNGISLGTLNSEYFSGYGTSTVPGTQIIDTTEGIDFSASNATFSISVNAAAAEAVTVDLDASGSDLNSDGIYGDRKDTLQAIQTAIDATALNGTVTASFNDDNFLIFTTTTASSTDTIEITAVGSSTSDILLGLNDTDGARTNGKDAGLTFGSNVEFNVVLDDTTSANTVSLPAGTYATGDDVATALETAINTDLAGDGNLGALITGATTNEGTRDISANIDFSAANSGFVLNVNGTEQTIIMSSNVNLDNIMDVQDELDAAFGMGVVTAQLGADDGLELVTDTQDHDQYIQVVSDGRGAYTTDGAVIASGINFSGANNATFDIVVNGITLNIDVNTDASAGDESDSLDAIQDAIDFAILSDGQLDVGDVVASLDAGTGELVIESVADEGIQTSATFGSSATIDIQNTDANAQAALGLLAADTSYGNGYDAFGMDNDITFGSDITADVEYEYDSTSDTGKFILNIGGHARTVAFDSVDSSAISFLGIHEPDGTEDDVETGLDVEGTINGVDATGNGQFLTAQNGNSAASNGYYVANQSEILSAGTVTIDGTNDTFTIELDGIEAVITIDQATYASGAALAAAVEDAINTNSTIDDEGLKVQVDYTDDAASSAYGTIGIISTSTGSGSSVLITDVSDDASSALGFIEGQADGERGEEQDGDIDEASGIRVKVTGGDLGDRGSVTYISGIADQLKDLLQNILDPDTGIIATKFDTLDEQNETLAEDRESFDARIAATEARLKSQFLYNDAIIATLKTTENYLTQQFEAMANANS
jgi:flagellar hook-associated protein 2